MEPLRARAVVFDLDGTLLASMDHHWRSYVDIFRERLALPPPEFLEVALLEGQRAPEVIAQLARERGTDLPPERVKELGDEKQKRFREMGHPEPYAGAHALLDALKARRVPTGLATGTNRRNVEHMLGDTIRYFDVVVTGDDVQRAKPDPEPYLRAFDALGVAAADGVVVENAPLGIRAGIASGARVVAVSHTLPADRLAEAHVVVPTLADVERWIMERVA